MRLAPQETRTYFVTAITAQRRSLFQVTATAELFERALLDYRGQGKFLLHAFVIMPDHFHALITPAPEISLEKAMQFIKGGFSFRANKFLGWRHAVWATGFSDHRIRDLEDCGIHVAYIARNPVKARLVENAVEYPYSSANGRFELDAFPQGLKPAGFGVTSSGAAKAAPFQNRGNLAEKQEGGDLAVPVQSEGYLAETRQGFELDAFPQGLKPTNYVVASSGAAKAAPFQSNSEAARGTRGQTDRSE